MKAVHNANLAEKIFLLVCAGLWHTIRYFDPFKWQRYFAAKINVVGAEMNEVYSLPSNDAVEHICRINNNRMKDGEGCLAKRGELVKIVNPATGNFVMRYVYGAGEHRIRFNCIGLDYHAKLSLGIVDTDKVDLQVVKANAADREFYLMYQDRSVSSRQSRALGWYIFLGSMLFGAFTQAMGWVSSLMATFF